MVALAIFATGVLGILQMTLVADGQNSLAARETKAANLGRDLADAFGRLPFNHPAFAAGTQSLTDSALFDDSSAPPLLGAAQVISRLDVPDSTTVRWTSTPELDATGVVQGTHLEIDVSFRLPSGRQKTLQFFTYKYRLAAVTGGDDGRPEI
jgi:hypothetical protein